MPKICLVLLSCLLLLGGLVQSAAAEPAPAPEPVQQQALARGCFSWHSAVASYGGWSRAYKSDCAVFGSKGHRVGYAWSVAAGSNGRICVQARGYKLIDGVRKARWFGMGCGTSGSGTVPWGNVAATPAVRAKVQPGFLGGAFRWRH